MYRSLRAFCAGLRAVLSATATGESDVLLVNYEGSAQQRMLSNLSHAGIVHEKKSDDVQRMCFLSVKIKENILSAHR